jgi:hypothetical protein
MIHALNRHKDELSETNFVAHAREQRQLSSSIKNGPSVPLLLLLLEKRLHDTHNHRRHLQSVKGQTDKNSSATARDFVFKYLLRRRAPVLPRSFNGLRRNHRVRTLCLLRKLQAQLTTPIALIENVSNATCRPYTLSCVQIGIG